MEPLREEALEAKVTEASLRTILKGLEPTAEIVGHETVYYPVYEVSFSSERGERSIVLDGISGKELSFPAPCPECLSIFRSTWDLAPAGP